MAFSLKLPVKDFFSTQCIILLLFLWFSQIKIKTIKTKVCKPPIITKVKIGLFLLSKLFRVLLPTGAFRQGGGGDKVLLYKFLKIFELKKTIEKVIRLCTVLKFFFCGGCEGRPILRAFFGSKLSIYLQYYVKNGLIF